MLQRVCAPPPHPTLVWRHQTPVQRFVMYAFTLPLSPPSHPLTLRQALMLCFMMLVSPPLPFAIMPFAATALLNVCRCYMSFLQKLPGATASTAATTTTYYLLLLSY